MKEFYKNHRATPVFWWSKEASGINSETQSVNWRYKHWPFCSVVLFVAGNQSCATEFPPSY